MSTFNVELKRVVDDTYEIETGYELTEKLISDIKDGLVGKIKKFAVITDSIVEKLYANKIYNRLCEEGYKADLFVFEAGEKSKVRKTKEVVEDAMLEKEYRRDCCVIAVGGGVVTDLAGFLAGTFARGVPFINYATTLLAAADASVGGKTAVDTPRATNLIGLFNQPEKVYIDIATWKTLPKNQISSGMAETIKHACMADAEFFKYLEDNMDKIMQLDKEACDHISNKNCEIKYKVVMQDEKESGLREILNLGHTVGRAIETLSEYRLLHGEAVSIGLVAETHLARKLGYMDDSEVRRVRNLLKKANLPVAIPKYIDREALVDNLYTDKKVRDGKLRFVVQYGIGSMVEFDKNNFGIEVSREEAVKIINEMEDENG